MFTNIIKNALQALQGHEDSDIIVVLKDASKETMLRRQLPASFEWVEISISDNGPGIPENIQSKIFMPNFTMNVSIANTNNSPVSILENWSLNIVWIVDATSISDASVIVPAELCTISDPS